MPCSEADLKREHSPVVGTTSIEPVYGIPGVAALMAKGTRKYVSGAELILVMVYEVEGCGRGSWRGTFVISR